MPARAYWSGQIRLALVSIPVQVFYDEKGKEVFRHVGFFPEKEVLKQVAKLGVE